VKQRKSDFLVLTACDSRKCAVSVGASIPSSGHDLTVVLNEFECLSAAVTSTLRRWKRKKEQKKKGRKEKLQICVKGKKYRQYAWYTTYESDQGGHQLTEPDRPGKTICPTADSRIVLVALTCTRLAIDAAARRFGATVSAPVVRNAPTSGSSVARATS
jgi:hypothetical protein